MRSNNLKILGCLIGILMIVLSCACFYNAEKRFTAKVMNITTQQHVGSNGEGAVSTCYDYIVSTDKGLYKIEPAGVFASKSFGTLEVGKTYHFHTRGIEFGLIGMYPFIIDAREEGR